jgi:hypothetical protein
MPGRVLAGDAAVVDVAGDLVGGPAFRVAEAANFDPVSSVRPRLPTFILIQG